MQRRVFIRLDDDTQRERIDSLADSLRSQGLEVSDVSPVVGQITGIVNEADLERVQHAASSLGARFIHEHHDVEHNLPDPDSELQ